MLLILAISTELLILFLLSKRITNSLFSLFISIFRSQQAALGILSLFYLPGVALHELSHLIVAEVLRVPTGELYFTPQAEDLRNLNKPNEHKQEIKMGSLKIGKTDPIRRYLIGFAPVLLGLFFLSLLVWLFQRFWPDMQGWKQQALFISVIGYFLFSISNNMFSSRKDLEGFLIFLPILILAGIALYITGVRIILTGTALNIGLQVMSGLVKSLGIVLGVNTFFLILNRLFLNAIRRI